MSILIRLSSRLKGGCFKDLCVWALIRGVKYWINFFSHQVNGVQEMQYIDKLYDYYFCDSERKT